jgi:two-component system response regulator AtoC
LRHESKSNAVIVAEADAIDRAWIEMVLNCEHYAVMLASGVDCVRSHLATLDPVAAVVLGNLSPRKIPFDLLCDIRKRFPVLPVIAISDAPSSKEVVEAMKCGATDVLAKPVCRERLRDSLSNALASSDARMVDASRMPSSFLGNSPAMRRLMSMAHQVGFSDAPVLIRGETGVGKEVVARHLHAFSCRAGKPFLKVNCAALPSELIEGELFGYNRGAFTNADQNKPGMFERADTGSILLDEIGDMELRLQAKLLEVLQDQQFYRLGGNSAVRVNVRIIAATHVDLETAVENGAFRARWGVLCELCVDILALWHAGFKILPRGSYLIILILPSVWAEDIGICAVRHRNKCGVGIPLARDKGAAGSGAHCVSRATLRSDKQMDRNLMPPTSEIKPSAPPNQRHWRSRNCLDKNCNADHDVT